MEVPFRQSIKSPPTLLLLRNIRQSLSIRVSGHRYLWPFHSVTLSTRHRSSCLPDSVQSPTQEQKQTTMVLISGLCADAVTFHTGRENSPPTTPPPPPHTHTHTHIHTPCSHSRHGEILVYTQAQPQTHSHTSHSKRRTWGRKKENEKNKKRI